MPGLVSFADWQQQNFRRLGYRAQWQSYFDDVDVVVSPVALVTASEHDHGEPHDKRKIATVHGPRDYDDMLSWIAPATLTECPVTIAPVGRGEGGLPIGLQNMGPHWEDATPIIFAKLVAQVPRGFVAPPGYQGQGAAAGSPTVARSANFAMKRTTVLLEASVGPRHLSVGALREV